VRVTVPGPGKVSARARAARIAVGRASRRVSRAGKATLKLAPSRAAKRALRSRKRLAVSVKVAFKPAGGGPVSKRTRRVVLRR
jgi:hypothetical protein